MTQKNALLAIIVLGHIAALYFLDLATRYTPSTPAADSALLVDFIVRELSPVQPVRLDPATLAKAENPPPQNRILREKNQAYVAQRERIDAPALTLINKDGSIILPTQTREEFLNAIDDREFAVQRDGLDAMEKLLDRPVALEYKSTVFEGDWQGDKPPLERILEQAVEKSTVRIKIPIPGRPGAYLRCGIAILAMGGSCGFTANDDGYYVRGDDPDTLSPEEDRQCKAWWDLIVSAKTQALWRKTKQLYQQECEKPLAK